MSDPLTLFKHDMLGATAMLETAASDIGDDFLQYLYGMAALHLEEQRGALPPIEPPALDDFQIAIAAKLVAYGQ